MSPRLFCNVVYAWLLSGCPDGEARDKVDAALYEPLEGTAAATSRLLHNLELYAGGEA